MESPSHTFSDYDQVPEKYAFILVNQTVTENLNFCCSPITYYCSNPFLFSEIPALTVSKMNLVI